MACPSLFGERAVSFILQAGRHDALAAREHVDDEIRVAVDRRQLRLSVANPVVVDAYLISVGTEWSLHYGDKVETCTLNVVYLTTNDVVFGWLDATPRGFGLGGITARRSGP